jgi:DNA-binding response OmpR family regulator
MVLSDEGYDVRCASTIAQGLDLARTHQPRVILFDMSLTDGDGSHFVAEYRQLPQANARLIAVSGIPALEEETARIGADAYLPKPFDLDVLLTLVAQSRAELAETA